MKPVFVSLLFVLTSCMYASDAYSPKQRGKDREQIKLIKGKSRHKDRFGKKFALKREEFRDQHLSSTNPATKQALLDTSKLKSRQRRGRKA